MNGVNLFTRISGLMPNPTKCACFFGNVTPEVQSQILSLNGFVAGNLPIIYLGLPLVSGKLKQRDCQPLINKLCEKNQMWTSKSLNQGGRAQLIKAILFSIQSHWTMHLFLQKTVIKQVQDHG